ncbi:MAG: GNAT family N-acetyltransferase [Pseudomonadota bacterium]
MSEADATSSLILPCAEYEQSYRAYIDELGDDERYPFPLDFEYDDFAALLRRLRDCADGIGLPKGFVASSTYWLVDGGELLGVSNLRHELNEALREHGGHIGLGVRPAAQGRGLGKLLLALTIQEARRRGIKDVHVHCNKGNHASAGMILANGGVLQSEGAYGHAGEIVQRYVVVER